MKALFSLIIAIACTLSAMATVVIVDGTNVRFRMGPSTDHAILKNAKGQPIYPKKGTALTYLATEENFYKVKYNGQELYISRDYTHLSDSAPQKASTGMPATTAFEKKLIGKHLLSLQWISWDYFGSCNITKVGDNRFRCVGEQLDRDHKGDFLRLDGYLSVIDEKHLVFDGKIISKIYHLNGGEEYVREGTYNFVVTQNRKYWRMQEMDGPDGVTDYVDIYFKR
ncbi:MAG: hypothetical protein HUK11_05740 [Muribaculaceae bacterium]|nr:hypothetical protein [Muribaculaceae bacterium]